MNQNHCVENLLVISGSLTIFADNGINVAVIGGSRDVSRSTEREGS